MSKLTLIGDIVHGEKYTNKEGQEKWHNTPLGKLFIDDDGKYVVKYLGQWCKVFPPKMKEEGYQKAKEAVQNTPEPDFQDDNSNIPF